MKYSLFLIFMGTALLITSCKPKVEQSVRNPWSTLIIESEDHTVIAVYPDSDTVTIKIYNTGTIFYRPKKVTTDALKVFFTKAERDSIFLLTRDIIATSPAVKVHCTDFVGDLKLKIYYGESCTQAIDYSGVCNWNTLSDKTMALHDILKRRMKNVFLGEENGGRGHAGG